MSRLPATRKEISENPQQGVTSPTDPKVKAADVDRKMKLYGVVQALREGKLPSNRQINEALDYSLAHAPIETKKLSKEGRMLVQDVQNIIRTVKHIVNGKNGDELIQEFLYSTQSVDVSSATSKVQNVDTGAISTGAVKADKDQAVEHLRTLGKLIFTNSEFRKLLKDISLLGRDVAADAAVKAASTVRPDEEALARVDEPAPSEQWVHPDGTIASRHEPVPSTGLQERKDQALEQKDRLVDRAQQEGGPTMDRLKNAGQQDQRDPAQGQGLGDVVVGGDAFQQQAQQEGSRLRDRLADKIPQEHQDMAKEQYQKAKNYAKDKFPEERRNRFIYRLKKVIVENQKHRDYQDAIEFFLEKIENYSSVAQDVAVQSTNQASDARGSDGAYQKAEMELRTLLERFANGQSMQPIFDAVNQLYTDAKEDPELKSWFRELGAFVRRALQEPGYIMKESSDREADRIQTQGQKFFNPENGRYASHKDAVFDTITTFFTAYAEDRDNVQLGEDVKKLVKDLVMDSEGNLKYKNHLWNDVRSVILPSIVSQVGYIPIPRIEYTDDTIDVVLENLTLESANLIPNIVEVDIRNFFKISPYDAIKDVTKHSFTFSFSQVQADLKDVAFYVNKKRGFPKISDEGVADVLIGGHGISGTISVASSGRKNQAFKVMDVKVKIDKLKFAVRGSKHSLLISVLKPLATGLIKKAIAKAIEQGLRSALEQLDAQLSDINERLEAAKDDENVSTLDVIKETFTDKKEDAVQTKEQLTPPGRFQVTAKRDSRIIDWSSPHSMIEKEGVLADRAAAGRGWKSPAFNIIGAPNHGSTVTGGRNSKLDESHVTGVAAAANTSSSSSNTRHQQQQSGSSLVGGKEVDRSNASGSVVAPGDTRAGVSTVGSSLSPQSQPHSQSPADQGQISGNGAPRLAPVAGVGARVYQDLAAGGPRV